jgi:hypothetical protein
MYYEKQKGATAAPFFGTDGSAWLQLEAAAEQITERRDWCR